MYTAKAACTPRRLSLHSKAVVWVLGLSSVYGETSKQYKINNFITLRRPRACERERVRDRETDSGTATETETERDRERQRNIKEETER